MLKIIVTIFALFAANLCYGAVEIEGDYDCRWLDVGTGKVIAGTMSLKKTGETYTMKSTYDDHSSYRGTGIYDETTHQLAIAFYNPIDLKDMGLSTTIFDDKVDKTWRWASINTNKIERTNCTKKISPEVNPQPAVVTKPNQ